mmetsp:Transcript_93012/g.199478  ORF Transcript_93012/g.199478 Transcript_93012/m.199478 type:complete len:391 (-) Transcript_93012:135-1307(-)
MPSRPEGLLHPEVATAPASGSMEELMQLLVPGRIAPTAAATASSRGPAMGGQMRAGYSRALHLVGMLGDPGAAAAAKSFGEAAGGSSAEAGYSAEAIAAHSYPAQVVTARGSDADAAERGGVPMAWEDFTSESIARQVEAMVLSAKRVNEAKVEQEIQKIKGRIETMDGKIRLIVSRLSRIDSNPRAVQKVELQECLAGLDEAWEGELGSLKQALWQTIRGHNHNADLMRQIRQAIDTLQLQIEEIVRTPMGESMQQLVELEQRTARWGEASSPLGEYTNQLRIEQLAQRLDTVEQRLQAMASSDDWGAACHIMAMPSAGAGVTSAAIAAPGLRNAGQWPPGSQSHALQPQQGVARGVPRSAVAVPQQGKGRAAAKGMRAEAVEFTGMPF